MDASMGEVHLVDGLLEVVCSILVASVMLLTRDPRCLLKNQREAQRVRSTGHALLNQWSQSRESVLEVPFGLRCGVSWAKLQLSSLAPCRSEIEGWGLG